MTTAAVPDAAVPNPPVAGTPEGAPNGADNGGSGTKLTYIVVGAVAAAVSAATVAYILWSRHKALQPKVESVQDLLEKAHDKMRLIEKRLGDLHQSTTGGEAGAE